MGKIGYARVSTADQSMDLLIDSLKASGCERIFEEKVSGKNSDRIIMIYEFTSLCMIDKQAKDAISEYI